jgi:pimeloyl-ACP methyl ester carboxylesterase
VASDRPLTREWGPADGRPLVFWPGLNPFGELYLVEIGPLLAEQGVRTVSIAPPWDLPTPDDYLPSRLADYVLEVAPFERFVFMGFSWGGSIGVQLAADHPERLDGLVLLDAAYADIELGALLDDVVRQFEVEQAKFAFDSWEAFRDWVGDRPWERYRAGMVERDGKVVPSSSPRAAGWALRGVATEKQTATHDRLELPILLLLARDADAGMLPGRENVETHRLDAGHDVGEDQPAETARLVLEWLARLPADG